MKNHGKIHVACCLLLTAASVFFAACKSPTASVQSSAEASGAREVTDDLGRRVKLPANVERAVSLAPNLTEIAFAVGAGDRLVGVTTYCDYPSEAQKIQKIGDTLSPNLETITALKPQIVFVSTASQIESFTNSLDNQNIAVFITNPQDVDGVYKNIFQFGEIFGKEDKARRVVDEMKKRVADIEARTGGAPDVKVFVQISNEPLFTVGKSSFLNDLINHAGGVSVTGDLAEAYPKFSKETALAAQPDAIILSDSEDNRQPNEVFKNSPAVRNGRVFRIDAELMSRPGPRVIDGLEQIAKSLHPEGF